MITDPKFKEGCYFFYRNTKGKWLIGKVIDIYTGNGTIFGWDPITISFEIISTSFLIKSGRYAGNTFEVGSALYRNSFIILNLGDE